MADEINRSISNLLEAVDVFRNDVNRNNNVSNTNQTNPNPVTNGRVM